MPIIICGNKIDLLQQTTDTESFSSFVTNIDDCKYIEVSAKTKLNIDYLKEHIFNKVTFDKTENSIELKNDKSCYLF